MPDTAIYDLDVRPLDGQVSSVEWETRVNLAAAFRAAYHFGWNDTINNHITARIADAPDQYLMNPVGLSWGEMTASCLIKLDLDGEVLSDTNYEVAPAGKNFHSAVLRARADLDCCIHIHHMDGVVVSSLKDGLRFYDQSGCSLYGIVGYHDFEGMVRDKSEGERIVDDLADGNWVLIMRNHGLLSVGRTIGEAFHYMHRLVLACETQVRIMATGGDDQQVPQKICEHTQQQMQSRTAGQPFGERAWPAMVRLADRLDPSYRR